MKQSVKQCMMGRVGGCIDPCHGCPNMIATCPFEQGSKECYKTVCPTCKEFRPKGTLEEQRKFIECYKKMYGF